MIEIDTARPAWTRITSTSLLGAAALAGGVAFLASCGSNTVDVPVYTQGVETEVVEMAPGDWRIADERVVADTADTRVIARGMNGVVDTFAYAELSREPVAPATANDSTASSRYYRRRGFGTILLYGLIGNRLGGYNQGITGPRANAYVSRDAYNRVQNGAGQQLRSTARTITRPKAPSAGRSGYGSGRSGRSFGG